MKSEKITSEEAGKILPMVTKKEIVTDHFQMLLGEALKAIDEGQFDKEFCPGCVLNYVIEQNNNRWNKCGLRVADFKLPIIGEYKDYDIYYQWADVDWANSAPVGHFTIEGMRADLKFDAPVNGKFNIDYPFHNVLFEGRIVNAQSVGEILSQIQIAFELIYESVEGTDIGYNHGIDELVFGDHIRIYENGTIEFSIES